MHYRTQKVDLEMAPREQFVAAMANEMVVAAKSSELSCDAAACNGSPQIILLDPAL